MNVTQATLDPAMEVLDDAYGIDILDEHFTLSFNQIKTVRAKDEAVLQQLINVLLSLRLAFANKS